MRSSGNDNGALRFSQSEIWLAVVPSSVRNSIVDIVSKFSNFEITFNEILSNRARRSSTASSRAIWMYLFRPRLHLTLKSSRSGNAATVGNIPIPCISCFLSEQRRKYWCLYVRTYFYACCVQYSVLYQCDSGYAGTLGETWMLMTCINQLLHACLI